MQCNDPNGDVSEADILFSEWGVGNNKRVSFVFRRKNKNVKPIGKPQGQALQFCAVVYRSPELAKIGKCKVRRYDHGDLKRISDFVRNTRPLESILKGLDLKEEVFRYTFEFGR